MDSNQEFILEIMLDDNLVNLNQTVALTLQNIAQLNSECNRTISKFATENIPNAKIDQNLFFESIVQQYTDEEYRKTFKMSKLAMQKLVAYLRSRSSASDRMIVPFDKKVHLTVYMLANKDTFSVVGDLFGLHKSSVNYIFHEICSLIAVCQDDFISWPSEESLKAVKSRIQNQYNLPNCVGFIDGFLLQVRASKRNRHNLIVQVICDDKYRFLDVCIGKIGCSKNSQVFINSAFYKQIKSLIGADDYLLGNSTYPLMKNIMTPFRDNGELSNAEKKYNAVHAKARHCAKTTFNHLNRKFRRLKDINIIKVKEVSNIILASCSLYNFILLNEEEHEEYNNEFNQKLNLNFDNLTPLVKRKLISDFVHDKH